MERRSHCSQRSPPSPLLGFHMSMPPIRVSAGCLRSVSPKARFSGPPPPRGGGSGGASKKAISSSAQTKRTCMCSPTTHPGSFRCSVHRKSSSSFLSKQQAGRSGLSNSLEGEWVRRALTALIRPSSHQMRRRMCFDPQPSRLRHMSRAE